MVGRENASGVEGEGVGGVVNGGRRRGCVGNGGMWRGGAVNGGRKASLCGAGCVERMAGGK